MANHFWRDWGLFYLPTMQKRHKWTGVSVNISVGDLVLLKETNAPRNQWSRARVWKMFAGKDGLVCSRGVMKPNRKVYIRDTKYVCPIECFAEDVLVSVT